jgi:CRISPR-associated Csx2 family protein
MGGFRSIEMNSWREESMTTLISFLGKGKGRGGAYRTATYRFPDHARTVPFFGMALSDYLKPDRLILIGTAGSMWDVFFENEGTPGDDSLLALIDAVAENTIDENLLENHAQRLTEKLDYTVHALLIGEARGENGQVDLLARLARLLEPGERIALDITHSYRHLPPIALVAARFLARVKQVEVNDIYYGALEMTDAESGETPVIRLKGLLDMLDWVDALAAYDKNGDYDSFPALYARAQRPDAAGYLGEAAFFERTNQTGQARGPLRQFLAILDAPTNSPMLALVQPELKKRFAWVREENYANRQEKLARLFFKNGDYLRAAIQGFESVITRKVQQKGGGYNPMSYNQRQAAKEELEGEIQRATADRTEAQKAYLDLRNLRNTLSHGVRADLADIQGAMRNEESLRSFLGYLLQRVCGL